ncbi:hypothetical protein ACEWY4_011675 [Coilia grayii]|uniref:Protein HIRA-like C-terminal domain-containing protein n=1 Tax=Coilia grayii TaxID=363190 RepID=A0ABD1JYB9_9TELE
MSVHAQTHELFNPHSRSATPSTNSIGMKNNLFPPATKIEPMKALDSRFTERSKVTPGLAVTATPVGLSPLDRAKDGSALKEAKLKEDTSSDSEEKMAMKPFPIPKRKGELEGAEVVEKRKKGRPRKDTKMLMPMTQPFPQIPVPVEKEPTRAATAAATALPAVQLKLPTPAAQKSFTYQVSAEPSVYLEVENEVSLVAGTRLSQLRCFRDGREWDSLLPSRILVASGSLEVVAVACDDRTLSVFSACGRRLLPSILLPAPVSNLHCSGHFLMVLTAAATLSVWDVQKQMALVKNESLHTILSGADISVTQSLLTQQGVPVIGLSNGKSYCFSAALETWNLIADKQDSLVQCADFRNCVTSQEALSSTGPLALMQGRAISAGRLASRLSSTPHHLQQGMTLAFLENQLAAALTLASGPEYRHWVIVYTRFLVNEGYEQRLRELCKDLLGPVHKSTGSSWEPTILGQRKRDLLHEVLPVIGQNLRFQRLFTEYQDQLELLRNK